ncbi:MAG: ATP-binding cassette domain-containing protein [Candidatus Paceibacterota bacterium]|jgi:ATPase subunit of ABC transporter with duplicated ATPase domains
MAKTAKNDKSNFAGDNIIRFDEVTFDWGSNKRILDEVRFTVRKGSKISLMGQNGAGKSTIFGLIIGDNKPESGEIFITNGVTVATAKQVIPRDQMELTVRDFFSNCFLEKIYDIDPRIDTVLEVVNLKTRGDIKDRQVKSFSGGQQARLLLASALIQDPDILLLDEPTNNLDKEGIDHLTQFLIDYKKTCLVISHDADFLNSFTHGVLYLDVYTKKVEQYVGDYKDVLEEIGRRIEKENMENSRLMKEIEAKKYQAGLFAQKGGQMRLVAKRMREKAEELEGDIVDVRKEDRTIKEFTIPSQKDLIGEIIKINGYSILSPTKHKPVKLTCNISLRKNTHLLISGPNGIGKSTMLESIVSKVDDLNIQTLLKKNLEHLPPVDATIASGVRVGYYRQDFSMMDFNDTVYESLEKIIRATEGRLIETELRAVAASFLISADNIHTKIASLSEGQKGLVAFARLVLLKPGLLILDEPTNHINFRHIPQIAKALDSYEGAMILISHVPEFVSQIRIDQTIEMGKGKN